MLQIKNTTRIKTSDAISKEKFEAELKELEVVEFKEPQGCRCGEILRGLVDSGDCPLFKKVCTPDHPVGPCMVPRGELQYKL